MSQPKDTAQLIDVYKHILQSCGCVVDEKGFVSINKKDLFEKDNEPLLISGSRLVLPTREHLTSADPNSTTIFHPLHEHATRSESAVVQHLRRMISTRLSVTTSAIMSSLLDTVASTSENHKLNPDQQVFLMALKDISDKTPALFAKYLASMAKTGDFNSFVNIYLRKGGKIDKNKFNCVGVVSFPEFKAFTSETKTKEDIRGVSFSPKERGVIRELFEAVFPNIEVEHAYSYGSNDMIAPIMSSLMLSFANVAVRLNEVLSLFGKIIPKAKELMIDVEWVDAMTTLQDWHAIIRSIPMQRGCDGSERLANAPAPLSKPGTLSVNPPQPAVVAPPVVAAAPAPQHFQPIGGMTPYVAPPIQQPQHVSPGVIGAAPRPGVIGAASKSEQTATSEQGINLRQALAASPYGQYIASQTVLPPELARQASVQNGPMSYPGGGYPPPSWFQATGQGFNQPQMQQPGFNQNPAWPANNGFNQGYVAPAPGTGGQRF